MSEREELKAEKAALQVEIERLRKLNDEQQAEMLSWHMRLTAKDEEMRRLRLQWEAAKREAEKLVYESGLRIGEAHKEIVRLALERKAVRRAIEELLERYGAIAAEVPHSGLGRGGLK